MDKILNAQILNLDVHPSLFGEKDIFYLLNGDIQGFENGNQSYFVQNQMSNSLCIDLPEDYIIKGKIELDNNEVVLFIKKIDTYEIGLANLGNCTYESIVSSDCLNFEYKIRGVYKYTNKANIRRVYFIDGNNRNRFFDIHKVDGVWQYPKKAVGSKCESCDYEETSELDCEALNFNRTIKPPCISLNQTPFGTLNSGVYQIGIAYGDDDMVLTDYYLSQPIKIFSPTGNTGLDIERPCQDSVFSQIFLIIVSQTRENSLIAYKVGTYSISSTKFIVSNLANATILSTDAVLLRRLGYDMSKHIATNGETLLLGRHKEEDLLDYQLDAFNIVTTWDEIKVPKSQAHFYPSLMRDENYAFAIEWFNKQGHSLGVFHIPGRTATAEELEDAPVDNDIYELEDCEPADLKKWQIENTATQTISFDIECEDCSGATISKYGVPGYWQAETLLYPNTEEFGEFGCTPIRHHKMPSNQITHIHGDYEVTHVVPDCEFIDDGEGGTYEYCPPEYDNVMEDGCVNVLAVDFTYIAHPKDKDGNIHQNIGGYRILVGDRTNNKSVLHKGLLFNLWEDTSGSGKRQLYSNYPFNDLYPDVYLSTTQNLNNSNGSLSPNWNPPSKYLRNKFTYHSPNIHFQETSREFGTELKVYGEEIGWIEGNTTPFYKHPNVRLGFGDIQNFSYAPLNKSVNSVAHYGKFAAWSIPFKSRFKIETSQFLLPVRQITSDNERVNNWLRESSYYVSLNRDLQDPINKDVSRILKNEGVDNYSYSTEVNRGGSPKNVQGVSYYTGIKQKNPDQYGNLEQITYRPVTCIYNVNTPLSAGNPYFTGIVYAGDVYITKHSLLRKMPMFTQWLSDVPIDTYINYREYRNVWYPRFWYDNITEGSIDDQYNLDGQVDLLSDPDDYLASGNNYIFVTGVLDYWCESEFIGNYREQDITPNGQYYPNISYDDISRGDKVVLDNKFLYNFIFLQNNIEVVRQNTDRTLSDSSFITIFSQKENLQNQGDPWLQFLPLNYSLLPRIHGQFTGIHYTDMYNVFFIFENQILYSRVDYSLNLNEGGSLILGQGDIFSQRLQPLSNEKTGYVGSVDIDSFVNTRYGTFFLDRHRKRFFKWTGQLSEVTGNIYSWFQEFLLGKNEDENGIIAVFDNYTEKIYLTETNSTPWTWSYSPKMEGFVSMHSFKPELYIVGRNTFYSVGNESGVWEHNKEGYQNYYGEQYPFEVGFVVNETFLNKNLQSIQIFTEYIKKFGYNSNVVEKNKFFNKVLIYNNNVNTGVRTAVVKNLNNPNQSLLQNNDIVNPQTTEVSQVHDNVYRINKLESILVNPALPTLTWDRENYTVSNVNFAKNPITRDKIMGKWFKIHLRDETNSEDKILVQLYVDKSADIIKQ